MSESTSRHTLMRVSGYVDGYYKKESTNQEFFEQRSSGVWASNFVNGAKNPRWRALIKAGLNATTSSDGQRVLYKTKPYHAEEFLRAYDGGTPRKLRHTNYKSVMGVYLIDPYPEMNDVLSLSVVKADNQAKMEFIKKARRLQTTFQGGIAVGETLRTFHLIKSPFKKLRGGIDDYFTQLKIIGRRNRRLSRKRKQAILADTWLEYSFGWTPLLTDIDDATEALANSRYMQDKSWGNVLGVGTDKTSATTAPAFSTTSFGLGFAADLNEVHSVTVKYYGTVDVGSRSIGNFRRIGFDLSNWLPTAWELLPWSFLVDYVSNVQEVVSAASFARSGIRRITKTTIADITYTATNWRVSGNVSSNPDVEIDNGLLPGKSSVSSRSFSRDPYNGSLVPTLEFSLPKPKQLLNIAALGLASRKLLRYFK